VGVSKWQREAVQSVCARLARRVHSVIAAIEGYFTLDITEGTLINISWR
jgi:transposase